MLRSTFLRFAAASAFAARLPGATRPRYGGGLRLQLRSGLESLAPASGAPEANRFRLAEQVFEALLRFEEGDRLEPWLAVSWKLANGPKRQWSFRLREDVRFHDGSLLDERAVAGAIDGNGLTVMPGGRGEVLAASKTPLPLLRVLAEIGRGIAVRDGDTLAGSGPFRIGAFTPNRSLRLEAHQRHWAGRPFLDSVEIQLRSTADPLVEVELGRAQMAEIPVSEAPRAIQRGLRVWRSRPVELLLLELENGTPAIGEALSLSVDRDAIHRVILQGEGGPAAGLLPGWLTGYGFLFPVSRDLLRARQLLTGAGPMPSSIRYQLSPEDSLLRSVASRIAVDARAVGIRLEPATGGENAGGGAPRLRFRRVRIRSIQPGHALRSLATDLGRGVPAGIRSAQSVYDAERQLLSGWQAIPIAHVPDVYAVTDELRTAVASPVDPLGRLQFDQLWLRERA